GLLVALVAAALAVQRRGAPPAGEALVAWAAVVACIVASPAGWIMALVWALPLVPWLIHARAAPGGSPAAWWLAALAGVACAIPPPLAGWAAVAATALVAAVVALALLGPGRTWEAA